MLLMENSPFRQVRVLRQRGGAALRSSDWEGQRDRPEPPRAWDWKGQSCGWVGVRHGCLRVQGPLGVCSVCAQQEE